MIESSRRRILDTLNSRYLYRRVVRFLMYNTATCHHPCDDFIGGRGSTVMVAWCKMPQFWIFDGGNADLSAWLHVTLAITPYDSLSIPDCTHVETDNEI